MKEYIIASDAAGQRLDRYLTKRFPNAGKAFLQKMIRKKNITLNQHKTESNVLLNVNDTVQVYFSDETIAKFSQKQNSTKYSAADIKALSFLKHPIYEDQSLLVLNKPAGLLSQSDASGAPALTDLLPQMIHNASDTFHLAPANRLDRNTSGVILIPKDYECQKKILSAIRERTVIKEYLALVKGTVTKPGVLKNTLSKNENNTVSVIDKANDGVEAELEFFPIASHENTTLLKIILHTGKTHQIRVQLAHINHPIIGDPKYGDQKINQYYQKHYQLRSQLLHSFHYAIPALEYDFTAPLPDIFNQILSDLSYTEDDSHGILA